MVVVHLWWKIIHSLREIVLAKCEMTRGVDPRDVVICNHLDFPLRGGSLGCVGKVRRSRCRHLLWRLNQEGHWTPPPHGVFKINIDVSSQGNLGYVGIGGVGRDSSSDIQFIFSIYKGFHTNNLMELLAILYAL